MALAFCVALLLAGQTAAGAEPPRFMIEAMVRGQHIEGMPLTWSEQRVFLLGRDGRLWDFAPGDAHDFRKTASDFRPYSAREVRELLEAELGRRVEVSGTGHYLVAHPPGQGAYWSKRFEQIYREAVHYFGVRGVAVRQPEMPLVAIVFTRQADFQRYALGDGFRAGSGILGYYSPKTNRVALFDIGGGAGGAADWRQNGATVIHEAAHQVAFNTGVHSRFAGTPRWLAEGLGTLFEARGVWNSSEYRQLGDRINRGRLADLKTFTPHRKPGWLQNLIASDRPFEQNMPLAYCQSWALTFYLSETQPGAYASYLAKTAAHPAFTPYSSAQRLSDFTAAFGSDWQMLDARLIRFIGE